MLKYIIEHFFGHQGVAHALEIAKSAGLAYVASNPSASEEQVTNYLLSQADTYVAKALVHLPGGSFAAILLPFINDGLKSGIHSLYGEIIKSLTPKAAPAASDATA